jgi:hypothetical protein
MTKKDELAKYFPAPVDADYVLSPVVRYGDPFTAIDFVTSDDQFGRITFENLDSIKMSRGEELPFDDDWSRDKDYACWSAKVENSRWQIERYEYEKRVYGASYEFGGNVEDMLTDFSHYVFRFHDQFVEAIARGIWFEKSSTTLTDKPLQDGHPFLPLPETHVEKINAHHLSMRVRLNPKPIQDLIRGAAFCSQKLMEFVLEVENSRTVNHTLVLAYRNGKLISCFRGYFGREEKTFDHIATLSDVEPLIKTTMSEVAERRKKMGKNDTP